MKKRIIPIFVPHRGCPHDCIFCNQKKITGVKRQNTAEKDSFNSNVQQKVALRIYKIPLPRKRLIKQ